MRLGPLGGLTAGLILVSLSAWAQDTTPPDPGEVRDGIGRDEDEQDDDSFLNASWTDFTDPESPPVTYEIAAGTAPDCDNVEPYRYVGQVVSISLTVDTKTLQKPLTRGTKYFITVRATNHEGLSTTRSSDGIVVKLADGSLPPPTGEEPRCEKPMPDGGMGDGGLPDAGLPSDGGSGDGSTPEEQESPLGWSCGVPGGGVPWGMLVLGVLGLMRNARRR